MAHVYMFFDMFVPLLSFLFQVTQCLAHLVSLLFILNPRLTFPDCRVDFLHNHLTSMITQRISEVDQPRALLAVLDLGSQSKQFFINV